MPGVIAAVTPGQVKKKLLLVGESIKEIEMASDSFKRDEYELVERITL